MRRAQGGPECLRDPEYHCFEPWTVKHWGIPLVGSWQCPYTGWVLPLPTHPGYTLPATPVIAGAGLDT